MKRKLFAKAATAAIAAMLAMSCLTACSNNAATDGGNASAQTETKARAAKTAMK
ncbi:MAG: hypothetical protein IJ736_13070 [Firmicutes bacterium]|nr:hypothetical protein [Bacillota bacterium]